MLGALGSPGASRLISMETDEGLSFSSDTDLEALAAANGYRYARSKNGKEEHVIRDDGTVVIRAFIVPPELRGDKRKDPCVWLRSIRYHTYHGRPQDVGEIYLCTEDEAPNHIEQKFAVLDTPPPRAVRPTS